MPAPKLNPILLSKLLTLALNPAATEGEASNALAKIRSHVLTNGGDVDQFTQLLANPVFRQADVYLDFGKYKGCSVREVAGSTRGRSYLLWAYENVQTMSPSLRMAIESELNINSAA
jgi:hypothetical protein